MPRRRQPQPARVHSPLRTPTEKNKAALTAAGQRITRKDSESLRRLAQPWQTRAFAYYDILGEIKYASQFYSRMLSPLRLYAAKKDEQGEWVEIDKDNASADDEAAIEALERIQDPGGGREGLLGAYGRLMFLVGESLLFCSIDPDTEIEQWEMLSKDELRVQDDIYYRVKAPSLQPEEYREPAEDDFEPVGDDAAVAYRLWKRHPRYSSWADSTMEGVLDLCEELVLLTQAVRARTRSRLAGPGILFIDDVLSPPPLEPEPDEDPESDPLLNDVIEAATTAIQDEGSAAAVAPVIVRGSVPEGRSMKDLVYHLQLSDPSQLYPETGLRRELIDRIAIGLDMPPEVLTGLAAANHWSAWQVDEQTWKGHGQPLANQLVNDLNSSYYQPQLRQQIASWAEYAIRYDAAAIINHPDRTKDAKELWDRGAIGLEALRDAAGFDEDSAPTEQDRAERIGIATRDSSLAWYGIPSVKAGGLEPEPGVLEQAGTTTGEPVSGPQSGAEVTPGPPPNEPTETVDPAVVGAGNGNGNHSWRIAQIAGAADMALLRAREVAGNRILSLSLRDPDALAVIEELGLRARNVASGLGRDRVLALGCREADLVAGAAGLIAETLHLWGIRDPGAAQLIAEQIERHAARTLFDERPPALPSTFSSYVSGTLGVRG